VSADANVEKLREWFDVLGGEVGLAALLPLIESSCTEDVEFSPIIGREVEGLEPIQGKDGVRGYFEQLATVFPGFTYQDAEFQQVGDDVVLVDARLVGSGRGSAVPIAQEFSLVYEFREGLISRFVSFSSHDQALELAREVAR
jgi:ketosteroid isomerase-like protein